MPSATPSLEKLAALLELSQRFSAERTVGSLLDLIATEAARLVDAERASLLLLEEEGKVLTSRVALGSAETIRFDSRLGIAGQVVSSGKLICVRDAYADPRFYTGVDEQSGYRTRNLLAVPLAALDGEILGVFEVLNKREGTFEEDDIALVRMLATHAALAIRNASLIEELENYKRVLEAENRALLDELGGRAPSKQLLGESPPYVELREMIARVGQSDVTVLVTGESGTGKDLVARSLHYQSSRARGPYVALNCAALPDTLLETELFGVEKGVATGVDRRAGRFEQAQGGTLFLDEIGDLSQPAQAKILRALQERTIERVGGRRPTPVDVRVVAATNKDLEAMIRKGDFREDLYYRLNVVRLRTPALREVRSDVPLLAEHFLELAARELRLPRKRLSAEAASVLREFGWPGNVRQLENEMRRACVLARTEVVRVEDLSPELRAPAPSALSAGRAAANLQEELEQLEQRRIREALAANQYNQLRTAKVLGLSRQGLINKLKRYGITAPASSQEPES